MDSSIKSLEMGSGLSLYNLFFPNSSSSPPSIDVASLVGNIFNRATLLLLTEWTIFLMHGGSGLKLTRVRLLSSSSFGKPRTELSVETCKQKMWRNSVKAIEEHKQKATEEILPSLEEMFGGQKGLLHCTYVAAARQGIRPSMEDAHFCIEGERGVFAAILDGHGGADVALYASQKLQEEFFTVLEKTERNVHRTFEILLDTIQSEVEKKPQWRHIGSTAVLSFVDTQAGLIFTATLGDSEAFIYREDQSIPLSCVRDWSSTKDRKRACPSNGELREEKEKPRYWLEGRGTNVSRALGDIHFRAAVTHKAKITVNAVKPGDVVILGCDGVWDFVSQQEMLESVKTYPGENLAEELAAYALDKKLSDDNVSILAIKVCSASS